MTKIKNFLYDILLLKKQVNIASTRTDNSSNTLFRQQLPQLSQESFSHISIGLKYNTFT